MKLNNTTIGDWKPNSIHCPICHGYHLEGTTYICSPVSSNFPCEICQSKSMGKNYRYCLHCGERL